MQLQELADALGVSTMTVWREVDRLASKGEAIKKLGVAKVNVGTYLKQRYLRAVRAHLDRDCAAPHKRLGMGGEDDVMVAGRRAVRDAVLERIGLLGSCGRASACDSEGS